jgi:hypothetical protein
MAVRLTITSIPIHILIEGRPELTKRLWDRFPAAKPLVLSSHISSSPVYFATTERGAEAADREPALYPLLGTLSLPNMEQRYPEMAATAKLALVEVVAIARKQFALRDDEPVRIAVAGSQGSLWLREHANVATLGSLLLEDDDEEEGGAALSALSLAAQNRRYVAHLWTALSEIRDRPEVEWLADVFNDLRPTLPCERRDLIDLADEARASMRAGRGTVPLLYTRRNGGPWKPYTEHLSKDKRAAERGRDPFRSTGQLIQQYRDDPSREGLDCVLVKVVPRPADGWNPCDNPIITTVDLQRARAAGISAILLDSKYGVVDLVDEIDTIDQAIAWQRGQMIASLDAVRSPLVDELHRIRTRLAPGAHSAALEFEVQLAGIETLRARFAELARKNPLAGTKRRRSLRQFQAFRRLHSFFRRFAWPRTPVRPSPDPVGDARPPEPRPVDLTTLSDRRLVRELYVTLSGINDTLERGALSGPLNVEASLPIVESLGHDLTIVMGMVNEWGRRIEIELRREALAPEGRVGWFHSRVRRVVTGIGSRGVRGFLKALEDHAALERLIATKNRHAELAAYPGRPDFPPIYRV